jgi:hypothetical protein
VRLPKIDRVLATDGELQPLLAKTRDIRALAGLVDGFFPPDLARQVRVTNIREGELVLLAANSSAASKLRLLAPSLCRFMAMQRRQVNSVSIRVQPTTSHPYGKAADAAPQKIAQFSTSSLTALRTLYEGMADSPAREALRALLEHNGPAKPPPAAARQK